jgi:serine/threonine protein kinase/Flp pilus assembly protein TadD
MAAEVSAGTPGEPALPNSSVIAQAQTLLPNVGDTFLHFRLIDLLGEGAVGKVYLAEQAELADRYVALKISTDLLGEPAKLARLQHSAIMPVYSVHEADGLQAVCMPFFGRTTLADWCQSLGTMPTVPSSGQYLVSTLKSKRRSVPEVSEVEPTPDEPVRTVATHSPLNVLATLKYADAILLTIARIAEGLQHAHERGLVHQDLKPANILITDEGMPLILDFNLARDTRPLGEMVRAQVGGTLPYMSPEQLRGFSDRKANVLIDGRSDLYSLGLILFQLLAGRRPYLTPYGSIHEMVAQMLEERQNLPPDVRQFNPEVDAATASIVAHCLHPNPARRYQSASELVEDIRRHRTDLPLRYAANTSLSERLGKWMRRNPRLASPATALAAVSLLTLGVVAMGTQSTLAKGRAEYQRLHARGQQLLLDFNQQSNMAEHYLSAHAEQANWRERGQREARLALEKLGVFDSERWHERPELAILSSDERRQLEQRVSELTHFLLLSENQGSTVAPAPVAPRGIATAGFSGIGGSAAPTPRAGSTSEFEQRRQRLHTLQDQLRGKLLVSGRMAYLQAIELQSAGKHGEVLQKLKPYLQANPDDVNAWFTQGRSTYALGQHNEAYHAYSTCIALKPQFAPGYFNRALVAYFQGKDAVADLDTALKLDPQLTEARLLRAASRHHQGKSREALAELTELIEKGEKSPRAYFLRAAVLERLGQHALARADRQQVVDGTATDLVSAISQANVLVDRDPKAGLARFRALEKTYPHDPEPLLGQIYVLGEILQQTAVALETLERLVREHPDHIDGICCRAVYLARLGRDVESVREAQRALACSNAPFTYYRVGCAYALLSEREPRYKQEALRYLMQALEYCAGVDIFLEDPDLRFVRNDREFKVLIDFVRMYRRGLQVGERF